MSKSAPKVFKLSDMVVEEVSLVDRAANQHTFLVVKRDETGAEVTDGETATPAEVTPEQVETAPTLPVGLMKAAKTLAELAKGLMAQAEKGDTLSDEAKSQIGEIQKALASLLPAVPAVEAPASLASTVDPGEVITNADDVVEKANRMSWYGCTDVLHKLAGMLEYELAYPEVRYEGEPEPTADPGTAEMAAAIKAMLATVTAKFESQLSGLRKTVSEQAQTIAALESQPTPSNAVAPGSVAKATKPEVFWPRDMAAADDSDTAPIKDKQGNLIWPMDLNAPICPDNVPDEESFYDR